MFTQKELENPDTQVIAILEKKEDKEIQYAIKIEDGNGITLLPLFAKYRTEKEFIYLIGRLPPHCIESALRKVFQVKVRGDGKSENCMMRLSSFHMILAHQSRRSISAILEKINSKAIYDALTTENKIPETQRISWKKVIGLNKHLNEMIKTESPAAPSLRATRSKPDGLLRVASNDEIVVNEKNEGVVQNSHETKTQSQGEELITIFEKFIECINFSNSLTTATPRSFSLDASLPFLNLCMSYRDPRPDYLEWTFLHFVCAGIYNQAADSKSMQDIASAVIRHLNETMLFRLRMHTCQDKKFYGCNLLHFLLMHIQNTDDIQIFCEKSDDETLNKWLCDRIPFQGSFNNVGFKNMSSLQMMMMYLSLPSLKAIISRATPKTLYLAFLIDPPLTVGSGNWLSCNQLVEKNKSFHPGPEFDSLTQKILGIRLFYELYHYCFILKEKRNDVVNSRIEWVKKLINFLENPPDIYTFYTGLNQLYEIVKPSDKVLTQYLPIRPFQDIIGELCTVKKVSTIQEGYEACKFLYRDFFTPGVAAVEAPPKKTKISAQDDEVHTYKM